MLEDALNKISADEATKIIETIRDSILLLDEHLKVIFANRSFYTNFQVSSEETLGKKVYDIGNGQWDMPQLKLLLEETLTKNKEFFDYKVDYVFPRIGEKVMLLNGIKVKHDHYLTLLVISDVTAQEKAYKTLKESYESIETMNKYMVFIFFIL